MYIYLYIASRQNFLNILDKRHDRRKQIIIILLLFLFCVYNIRAMDELLISTCFYVYLTFRPKITYIFLSQYKYTRKGI